MSVTRVHTARALDDPVCIPLDEAIDILEYGEMDDEVGLMRWGSNYTFLVNIIRADIRIMAIYKPRKGERPLWDFPDGTLCNRETAAYLTSKALGWSLVPPTFLRAGTRGVGSVQLFIDHDPEEHYYTFDKPRLSRQLERMAIFDAIANNADLQRRFCSRLFDEDRDSYTRDMGPRFDLSTPAAAHADRKGGHCLVDEDRHLWGIDHGLTFNASEKLRTVIWDYAGMTIPAAIRADLEVFCGRLADDR